MDSPQQDTSALRCGSPNSRRERKVWSQPRAPAVDRLGFPLSGRVIKNSVFLTKMSTGADEPENVAHVGFARICPDISEFLHSCIWFLWISLAWTAVHMKTTLLILVILLCSTYTLRETNLSTPVVRILQFEDFVWHFGTQFSPKHNYRLTLS